MKRLKNRTIKILGLFVILLVALTVVFAMWLYSGSLNDTKIKIFTALPLPIASVNGRALYMPNYALRWQTYEQLQEKKLSSLTPLEAKKTIFNQMVLDEETAQISSEHGVTINQNELEAEYLSQATENGQGTQNSLMQFLDTYNLSKNAYKQYAIKPQLLAVKLQTWFNSQADLNPNQYILAKTLIEQIKSGQNMTTLAKQYSQEDTSKIIGGDLGFIDPTKLLWEMREPVYAMNIGDVTIIPSRAGIHIIKLEEKQANEYHLREIFLLPENFDVWLETQTKNFKTYKLITF
ncbi:MAG: peptidylprolyl isomerase [Candidatus Doudnabacteria bacterium]|jgi:hypothetical protein